MILCLLISNISNVQAQQVGLLTENHHYIIMSLDAHAIDLEPFQYSGTNFTIMRIVNPLSPLVEGFAEYMNNLEQPNIIPNSINNLRPFEDDEENYEAEIDPKKDENVEKVEKNTLEGSVF